MRLKPSYLPIAVGLGLGEERRDVGYCWPDGHRLSSMPGCGQDSGYGRFWLALWGWAASVALGLQQVSWHVLSRYFYR